MDDGLNSSHPMVLLWLPYKKLYHSGIAVIIPHGTQRAVKDLTAIMIIVLIHLHWERLNPIIGQEKLNF